MSASDNIEVEINLPYSSENPGSKHQAVIKDQAAGRAWSGEGDTAGKAATEATRKFINDRRVREYQSK